MERKPFVTYHGEPEQFNAIQVELLQSLPREKVEWKRSSDRVKMIQVDVNFVPFNADLLPHYDDLEHAKMLLQLPMLHVYFTDCPDTDAYRIVTKEKIAGWLNLLKERKIADWMIVLVEPANPRRSKSKLLPKFSVVDKIKNDFCGRQTERLIVLHEPNNPVPNNKTMESWAGFVGRLRQLFVTAYNRTFTKYKTSYEPRGRGGWHRIGISATTFYCRDNPPVGSSYILRPMTSYLTGTHLTPGWREASEIKHLAQGHNVMNYAGIERKHFCLSKKEELALAYESMGIYKEALVQYDELDALFSQFIINSQAGEKVSWLSNFTDSCNCWDGLNLSDPINKNARRSSNTGSLPSWTSGITSSVDSVPSSSR
ncbi:hypothetical protein BSL78_22597 [Apostichopus japonicus]|uniref:TRAPPC10/Trs130 N-terminal domain-containing protein n=1 Tax=Stichopus japonicus TaxID=307972 RepID=A0A2G8JXT8_STIJA|nr:hypothetical protein BSL78_22597 [Apostichopus japonicus]